MEIIACLVEKVPIIPPQMWTLYAELLFHVAGNNHSLKYGQRGALYYRLDRAVGPMCALIGRGGAAMQAVCYDGSEDEDLLVSYAAKTLAFVTRVLKLSAHQGEYLEGLCALKVLIAMLENVECGKFI